MRGTQRVLEPNRLRLHMHQSQVPKADELVAFSSCRRVRNIVVYLDWGLPPSPTQTPRTKVGSERSRAPHPHKDQVLVPTVGAVGASRSPRRINVREAEARSEAVLTCGSAGGEGRVRQSSFSNLRVPNKLVLQSEGTFRQPLLAVGGHF